MVAEFEAIVGSKRKTKMDRTGRRTPTRRTTAARTGMRAGDAMAHTGGTSIRIRARKAYTLVTANARSLVDRARRATVGSSARCTHVSH